MPELLKYSGLDLPVFDPNRQMLTTQEDYRDYCKNNPGGSFIRIARITAIGSVSLSEILKRTASDMEWFSEEMEARVVGHQYGLYKPEFDIDELRHFEDGVNLRLDDSDLLPDGMVLAAEVDVISNITSLSEGQFNSYRKAQKKYYKDRLRYRNGPYWCDHEFFQYKNGISAGENGLWLLDIEPKINIK